MHELSLKFKERDLTTEQKHCMFDLQKQALAVKQPLMMNSLDQSDAEEALATVDGVGQHRKRMEDGADSGVDRHQCERAGARPQRLRRAPAV